MIAQNNSTQENEIEKESINALWKKNTYANINAKSWDQILSENTFQWRPPYTVHLPIQPVHSPDFIHVDAGLTVTRRRVTENVSLLEKESYPAARRQETFAVQFAFDDPPFVPDFQQSVLSLEENKYPVVTANFFVWDIAYQIEYSCSTIDEEQSLLWMQVTVRNEGEKTKMVNVWTGINFQKEDDLFKWHYFPYTWDVSKWMPSDRIELKKGSIIKDGSVIGKVVPGTMNINWEGEKHFKDAEYNKKFGGHNPYYVVPSMRLKEMKNVIHAQVEFKSGEKKTFSIALLTNDGNVTDIHISLLKKSSAKENKEKAMAHFKSQFSKENTELQTSALQLMVKYPDKLSFISTQGGSTERFFVWVWEAVHMLRPMLHV